MLKKLPLRLLNVDDVLKSYGGFARFYSADVPVEDVVSLVPKEGFGRVLCCCEGGDFALTFMGKGGPGTEVFAFDICSAQLFVLAAKAALIKDPKTMNFAPSLEYLSTVNQGRIQRFPQIISRFNVQSKLVNIKTKKYVEFPVEFTQKFGVEIFYSNRSGSTDVYWGKDQKFLSAIRKNIASLRFIREDILFLPDLFKQDSLDIIFVSDIHMPSLMPFYIERLNALLSCLKSGGVVIGDADRTGDLDNLPTLIEIFEENAKGFHLKKYGEKGRVVALQKL